MNGEEAVVGHLLLFYLSSVVLAMGMGFDLIDGVCVNCTDYGQRFCGFVLRSGTVLLTGRRTKPLQQPVQQNV